MQKRREAQGNEKRTRTEVNELSGLQQKDQGSCVAEGHVKENSRQCLSAVTFAQRTIYKHNATVSASGFAQANAIGYDPVTDTLLLGGHMSRGNNPISLGGDCSPPEFAHPSTNAGILIGYNTQGRCLYHEILDTTTRETTSK